MQVLKKKRQHVTIEMSYSAHFSIYKVLLTLNFLTWGDALASLCSETCLNQNRIKKTIKDWRTRMQHIRWWVAAFPSFCRLQTLHIFSPFTWTQMDVKEKNLGLGATTEDSSLCFFRSSLGTANPVLAEHPVAATEYSRPQDPVTQLPAPTCVCLVWRFTIVFAIFHSVVVPASWPASLAGGLVHQSQEQQAESRSHPQVSPRQHFHPNGGGEYAKAKQRSTWTSRNAKAKKMCKIW